MEKVIRLFYEIQNTSSINDKRIIIATNKDNELFKKCLVFLLSQNIITGLSDKKLNKKVEITKHNELIYDFETIMDYLEINNSGKDSDILIVQDFIMSQPEEYRTFYFQIVTKKFRLGIDVKGVNKAIPNLIPTWEVQQAYPLSDKNGPKDGEWFALSQKLNGNNNGVLDGKLVDAMTATEEVMDGVKESGNNACPVCGNSCIDADAKFCSKCGAALK